MSTQAELERQTERTHETYDNIKVRAMLNEIDGKDHTGEKAVGVPALEAWRK